MNKINQNFLKSSYYIKDLKLCSIRLHDNLKFPLVNINSKKKKYH